MGSWKFWFSKLFYRHHVKLLLVFQKQKANNSFLEKLQKLQLKQHRSLDVFGWAVKKSCCRLWGVKKLLGVVTYGKGESRLVKQLWLFRNTSERIPHVIHSPPHSTIPLYHWWAVPRSPLVSIFFLLLAVHGSKGAAHAGEVRRGAWRGSGGRRRGLPGPPANSAPLLSGSSTGGASRAPSNLSFHQRAASTPLPLPHQWRHL